MASLTRLVLATVAMGVANLLYKVGIQAGATAASLLTAQAAVFVSFATLRVRLAEGTIRPTARIMRFGATAAALVVLALLLLLGALGRGDAGVVVPIAQMGFVVTALAGFLFLGERPSARTVAGLAAAVVALGSLAVG
jgi:uncharacterized membrane protein